MKKHSLIVVPGLGGENPFLRTIVNSWRRYGITAYIHDVNWRGEEKVFKPKLKRLVNQVDKLSKNGKVSLLGTSAGGSAVLNTFYGRQNKIYKVVNVCGRLREGVDVYPTLDVAAETSPAFKESVLLCEKVQEKLSEKDRKKVLTIRSLFDEIVPISTITLEGSRNDKIFSVEHMFSIALAMTIYSRKLISFLKR